jgi:hypothetical protein
MKKAEGDKEKMKKLLDKYTLSYCIDLWLAYLGSDDATEKTSKENTRSDNES